MARYEPPGLRIVERAWKPAFLRHPGLIVSALAEGSRAGQAGFRGADIIYAVNRRCVRTLSEFLTAPRSSEPGYSVNLLRRDFALTIVVR